MLGLLNFDSLNFTNPLEIDECKICIVTSHWGKIIPLKYKFYFVTNL